MLLPKYLNPFRLVEYFTFSMGGGDASKAPASQNVTTTSIPEYARPYVEKSLGQAAALTDISQNPYQAYGGQRTAAFTPMQAQAMQDVAGMQTAGQITDASNLAYSAGQQGLGAQQTAAGLQSTALGYGAAGAGYGSAASQYGAEGAAAAQQAAGQAQQGAQQYGAQGSQFGAQGAQFGEQGAQFGAKGAEYGAQGIGVGREGMGYGQQGAGFGTQAAGEAGTALGYGAGAANIGQTGMGYGALGAGIGSRGVTAAEQGFGAGQAYAQNATSPEAMQQYMSPYMQNVVAQQQREAIRQSDIQRQANQAAAVRSGAYGGSRAAVVEGEAQRGLQDRLAMIQAQGAQSAYDKAQQAQQFAANVGIQGLQAGYQGLQTGMQGTAQGIQGAQTGISGQQAALQGVGQAGQMYGLGIQGAQAGMQGTQVGLQGIQTGMQGTAQGIQGAQAGIQGAQTGIAGAQAGLQGVGQQIAAGQLGLQGAKTGIEGQIAGMQGTAQGIQGVQAATGAGQYGLQGANLATQAAGTLGQLGQTEFGQQQAMIDAQMRAGTLQQQQEQKGLDLQYQQYLDSLNYPYKQLGFMSDLYRGLPLSQSSQSIYQNPNPVSQLAGAGTALYGAYQMGKKKGGQIKESGGLATLGLHNAMRKRG